ncbi:MAG: hypothetical protein OEM94_00585 [Acidimicrobiia bacterium]|nr:hypothetical protein [Acidimicrobiia bacterium]
MKLALLGDPVDHSRSPAMHQAAMTELGIEGTYEARAVDRQGLEKAFEDLRSGALDGANVTMPHKMAAARLCDELAEESALTGVANTLIGGVRVVGALTDVHGIVAAGAAAGVDTDQPVLILGSGGAAAAALLAMRGRPVRVAARHPQHGGELLERLDAPGEIAPWGIPWLGAVVVNATPLGMNGESLPDGVVEAASGFIDLTYGASPTPAVELARSLDIPTADGLSVLAHQGAKSLELWTGLEAPIELMESVARGQ